MSTVMKATRGYLGLLALLVAVLLVGCGGGSTEDDVTATSPDDTTATSPDDTTSSTDAGGEAPAEELTGDIRLMVWYASDMWNQVADEFEKRNPGVEVTVEEVAYAQYYTKLNTEFASGGAPDVFGLQFQASVWGTAGLLAPLTDAVSDSIDDIPESLTRWGRVDVNGTEVQFTLPWTFVGRSLYGNLTAMQEAGIEIPEAWTLDDLVDAAKKMTDGDSYGLLVAGGSGEASIASTFGAMPLSEDGRTALYDSDEMVAHKTFMRDLIHVHGVSPHPDEIASMQDPFTSQQVKMTVQGSWKYQTYRDSAEFEWDILPNPSGDLPAQNYGGPDQLAVFAGSKNLDAAIAFVKFAVFDIAGQEIVMANSSLPVLTELYLSDELVDEQSALGPASFKYFLTEVTENGIGWGFSPLFSEIERMELDANYEIFSDPDSDVRAILDQLNSDVQAALDKIDQ